MAQNIDIELKEGILTAMKAAEAIGNAVEFKNGDTGIKIDLAAQVREDMLDFLLYLSVSDGFISTEESEFLEVYFDCFLEPEQMSDRIVEKGLDRRIFGLKVPASFQGFVAAEKAIHDKQGSWGRDVTGVIIALYRMVGMRFVKCDGNPTDTEMQDYLGYIKTLRDYSMMHLEGKYDRNTEFLLKKGTISGGIMAPNRK